MSTSGTPIDERRRIVNYKGHAIYIINFSHCTAKEILGLLELVRADIARHAPGSLLTLADFTEAQIDKAVATRMKEVLALDRPYVKKSAWVGTESMPHVFYEHFKNFSQRDFPLFNSQEAAMDWLVEGES